MRVRHVMNIALACFLSMFLCIPAALSQDEIKVENIEVGSGKVYEVANDVLEVGVKYYIDRDYIVTAMPEDFAEAMILMTANDDKASRGENFLRFTVNRPVVVWIAHDSRGEEEKGGTPPEWLSEEQGWEKHPDMTLEVTDTNMGSFILWSKEFDKGEVALGGNADPPAAGQDSNYLVLLTPGKELAVRPQGNLSTKWAEVKRAR